MVDLRKLDEIQIREKIEDVYKSRQEIREILKQNPRSQKSVYAIFDEI